MNIVFWNTCANKKCIEGVDNINACLLELISENDVDLLVLAEYINDIQKLCENANELSHRTFIPLPNINACEKITGLVNSEYKITSVFPQSRYIIAKIIKRCRKIIIAMIHNVDKLNNSEGSQRLFLERFCNDINEQEIESNCDNTIVVGDLNVNPFESGCISLGGMHAVPFREVSVNARTYQGKKYKKFYNPTWKFFGKTKPPYTTYYFADSGNDISFYWNAFDQVLIRPSLIQAFDESKFKIIDKTKNHILIKNGKPNEMKYSDHLPLLCFLDEELI